MQLEMGSQRREFICLGCERKSHSEVLSFGDLPYWYGIKHAAAEERLGGRRFAAHLVSCPHCELIQQPRTAWLDEILSFTYEGAEISNPSAPAGQSGWGAHVAQRFTRLLGEVTPERVLEIGCGRGHLLDGWKARGARTAIGFEPSASPGATPSGATIDPRSFSIESARSYATDFDLIYSFAVLEHVSNVREHLAAIASLLTVGGHVMLEVPNAHASLIDGDLGLFVHEHLSHFTPSTLAGLLASAGLELRALWHNRSEIIAHAVKPSRPPSPPDLASSRSEPASALLRVFRDRAYANFTRAQTLLEGSPGRIAFYGACATLCNLNAFLPAGQRDQFSVLDSDSAKWGRQISGVAVNVSDPSTFEFDQNLSVIAVPYAFQDAIIDSLRRRDARSLLIPLYETSQYSPRDVPRDNLTPWQEAKT